MSVMTGSALQKDGKTGTSKELTSEEIDSQLLLED
jgi:hypothetical protein